MEVITRNRHKARENVHARARIGFGFTSDWLKKWRENFEPISELSTEKPKQLTNYFRNSIENRSISEVEKTGVPGEKPPRTEWTTKERIPHVMLSLGIEEGGGGGG